jgi:hypothetical protein
LGRLAAFRFWLFALGSVKTDSGEQRRAKGEERFSKKRRGRLRVPLGWSLQSYLFFFAAFLVAFFAAFFLVAIFYSPFSILHGSCDITSSQFVLCIESAKRIVKQKKRVSVCTL